VVAAAVAFPVGAVPLAGVRDSKTLSAARRERLAPAIRTAAVGLGVGAASCREIDRLNIRVATALAMRRALHHLFRTLPDHPVRLLLDGLPMPEVGHPHDSLVDGDALCYSVAAAGIIAKVVRDRLMHQLGLRHPVYQWARNAGYGTAGHLQALRDHGATHHHRRSFAPISQWERRAG